MRAPAAATPLRAPLIVERYAIYDEIASGGMATVHFARLLGAQGFRRTVAAKRLLPHLTRDQEFSLMLVDEARLAARIRHPNVVSTLDVVQTDTELVLVMDYVHGESLSKLTRATLLRGETIPLPIAAAIMIDTLHGLHAAHEAKDERGQPLGIVHRDVSPQNLLVGTDGITRIADFGIAKAAGRSHTTRDGSIKGKFSYMAPEQLNQGHVTRLTDVFAASVVLWELLTGRRLFEGSSQAETVFRVMNAPIPAPSSFVPELAGDLDLIVARGLSRVPEERFATARDMALALESWAPPTRPSEIAAWVERIAEESLARRQRLLSNMEHAVEAISGPQASLQEAFLTPARQSRPSLPGQRPAAPEQETVVHPSLHDQQPPTVEPSTGIHRTRKGPGRVVAVLLLLLLVGAGAYYYRQDLLPAEEGMPAPAAGLEVVEPVVTPGAPASQRPRADLSADEEAKPALESPRVEAVKPERKPERESDRDKDRERDSKRTKSSRDGKGGSQSGSTRSAPDCDPPFSIDETGKRIFKVECM